MTARAGRLRPAARAFTPQPLERALAARSSVSMSSAGRMGLLEVVVHAGREAHRAVLRHRVRRECGDVRSASARAAGDDAARRLGPVELGHLQSPEHEVVVVGVHGRHGLQTVLDDVGGVAVAAIRNGAEA